MKPKLIRLTVKLSVLLLVIYLVSVTARPSREDSSDEVDFDEDDDDKDDDDNDDDKKVSESYRPEFPSLPSHVVITGDGTNTIQTLQSTVDYLEEFVRRYIAPHIDPTLPSDHFPDWLKKPSKPLVSEPDPALPTPAPEQVFIPPQVPPKPKPVKVTKKPPTEGIIIDKVDLHMGFPKPLNMPETTTSTTVAPNFERSTIATIAAIPEPAPAPPMELPTQAKPALRPDETAPATKPDSSLQIAQTVPAVVEQPAMALKPEMPKTPEGNNAASIVEQAPGTLAATMVEMPLAAHMPEASSMTQPSQEPVAVEIATAAYMPDPSVMLQQLQQPVAAPMPEAWQQEPSPEVVEVPTIVEAPLPAPSVAETPAMPPAEIIAAASMLEAWQQEPFPEVVEVPTIVEAPLPVPSIAETPAMPPAEIIAAAPMLEALQQVPSPEVIEVPTIVEAPLPVPSVAETPAIPPAEIPVAAPMLEALQQEPSPEVVEVPAIVEVPLSVPSVAETPAMPPAEIPAAAPMLEALQQEPSPQVVEVPAIVEAPLSEPSVAEAPAMPPASIPESSSVPQESAPVTLIMPEAPIVEIPLPVVSEMTLDTMMTKEPMEPIAQPVPEMPSVLPAEIMSEMAAAEAMVESAAEILPQTLPDPSISEVAIPEAIVEPAPETPVGIVVQNQEPAISELAVEQPTMIAEATGTVQEILQPAPAEPVPPMQLMTEDLALPDLAADLPPSEPVVGLGEAVEHPTINMEGVTIAKEEPAPSIPHDQLNPFDPSMADLYPPPIEIGSEWVDPMMMKAPEHSAALAQMVMPQEEPPIPIDPAYLESIKPSAQVPMEEQPELLSGMMQAEIAHPSEIMPMEPEPAVDAPHDHVDNTADTAVPFSEFPKEPAVIQMLLLEENVHPAARGLPTERKKTPVLTCHNCTIRIACTDCVRFSPPIVLSDPSAFPMTISTPGLEITADPDIHAILANYSEMYPATRATVFEMNNVEATFDGNQVNVEAAPSELAPELATNMMYPGLEQSVKLQQASMKADKPLVVDEPAPVEISPSMTSDRLTRPQASKVSSQSAMPVRRTMAGHDSPIRVKRAVGLILENMMT